MIAAVLTSVALATAVVDVPVATVWTSPSAPRAIDRQALGAHPDVRAWTASLDTAERRGLVGRIETQALMGERVTVLERRNGWSRVAVTDQPTPRDPQGYPGWIPSSQLTVPGEDAGGPVVTVKRRTATLELPQRHVELSYGTTLPLLHTADGEVAVLTPAGATGSLSRRAVWTAPPARATGRRIVEDARRFLGVRYLWGGTSAFGLDCSGLIELLHRARGSIVPRDADAQALAGRPVARDALEPGDVLLYGRRHVHHVALYAGRGRMVEAPDSSSAVRLVPMRSAGYAGARRLPDG